MSRWSEHVELLRGLMRWRPRVSVGTGTTIWLDGRHAQAGAGASVKLATINDVSAALKAIEALLPKSGTPGLRALRIVTGAPFVRYHALAWQALPKPQDWVPAARAQAVQAGAGAEAWRYAVTDGAWGRGRLAAAMPEALCAGIEQLCKSRKIRLAGIEPGFTHALRKHASRISDGSIAIVELEETGGDAAIAHIGLRHGGGWTGFIALPILPTLGSALDEVLRDAIALCASTSPERRYVIGPGTRERWSVDAALAEWLPAPWDVPA